MDLGNLKWPLVGVAVAALAIGAAVVASRGTEKASPPNVLTGDSDKRLRHIRSITNMPQAIAYIKPAMTDDENGLGHMMFYIWATEHMKWSDVHISKEETSFLKFKKDPNGERGKRICVDGKVYNIRADELAPGHKVFHGMIIDFSLMETTAPYQFTAVGDTGDIVDGSKAFFCGVATGLYKYDVDAGPKMSLKLVGMFDVPGNRK